MQTLVVYYKDTKEVIASIPLGTGGGIMLADVDFKIYDGTAPVFKPPTEDLGIRLRKNAFILYPKEER